LSFLLASFQLEGTGDLSQLLDPACILALNLIARLINQKVFFNEQRNSQSASVDFSICCFWQNKKMLFLLLTALIFVNPQKYLMLGLIRFFFFLSWIIRKILQNFCGLRTDMHYLKWLKTFLLNTQTFFSDFLTNI
jgi:hypothetical protein